MRSVQGSASTREGHEERVPLCIDLDATPASKGLPQQPAVLRHDAGVVVAKFVK
jgi:hypothetical protein